MIYDARQIANWFIKRARLDNRVLSVMSILKLTYIAHGQHLATYGEPLFSNKIQAWRYGPVIVEVYNAFRQQGMKVSVPVDNMPDVEEPSDVAELLEQVWKEYGNLPPFQLSKLTHVLGGPWDLANKIGGWYAPIPDQLIKQHYDAKKAAKRG